MPPDVPDRLKRFPLWQNRYPVFFTVAVNDGVPDFKTLSRKKQVECYNKHWCHLCGQPLGAGPYWFVLGPDEVEWKQTMSNGPMHEDCARYACRACPFLANPDYSGKEPVPPMNKFLVAQGIAGKPLGKRPAKIALVAVAAFRTHVQGRQYPVCELGDYLVTDWHACPQRHEP